MIAFAIVAINISSKKYLGYKFNGEVIHVEYNNKGYPEVTVNGEQYMLGMGVNFDHMIEEGDSLKKDSGDTKVILVKARSGKVIIFGRK